MEKIKDLQQKINDLHDGLDDPDARKKNAEDEFFNKPTPKHRYKNLDEFDKMITRIAEFCCEMQ